MYSQYLQTVYRVSWIAVSVILTACATLSPPLETQELSPQWLIHQKQISGIDQWRVNGKVSVRYKDQRTSYKVLWQCQDQDVFFSLYQLTGQKTIEFSHTDNQSQLKDQHGKIYYDKIPTALLKQVLGFELPVLDVCHWGKGIPTSAPITAISLTQQHRLKHLTQSRWQVSYLSYMDVSNLHLPAKWQMEQDGITLVMLAKQWDLSPPLLMRE